AEFRGESRPYGRRRPSMLVASNRLVPAVAWAVILALLAGCNPQSPPSPTSDATPAQVRSVPGKPLHIGLVKEPSELGSKFGGGATGNADYPFLFGAKLIHYDQLGTPVPVLVEEVPDIGRGSWRIFDDGRMDTTFKLRLGTWHDG